MGEPWVPPRPTGRGPRRLADTRRERVRELPLLEPPAPVALLAAGDVHPRLAAEPEQVLHRHDREPRGRGVRELDEAPRRVGRVEPGPAARVLAERVPPPAGRVVVVRPRVDDAVLAVRVRPVRVVRKLVEAELEHVHPGEAELVPQPDDRLGDHAEILGDQRQRAQLGRDGVEELAARPGPPRPVLGRVRLGRHGPVGDEAAEVVDAHEVVELERPAEALDPPAVARRAHRRPVVDRVAPALALVGEGVGRDAGDDVGDEELGMREVVGAVLGDVDREVADQPDAALVRVALERAPLALEAHLVGDRVLAGERRPLPDPRRMAGDERVQLVRLDRGLGVLEEPAPAGERRRGLVGRVELVRRSERQDLPPRLAGRREPVDERARLRPEPSARQRGRVQQDAARTR